MPLLYTYISCLDKELVKQHKLYKLYTYILYVIRDETLCLRADIHWKYSYLLDNLKVPKREIFDRSNFPDFYAIKSSWVCDLVVKILTYYFNF